MIAAMQSGAGAMLRAAREVVYPLTCLTCDARVAEPGLCPACWRDTPFLSGAACARCAAPLPGVPEPDLTCDECLAAARPWDAARAALRYEGRGRAIVLQLKHGDRTELADAAAMWLRRRARSC